MPTRTYRRDPLKTRTPINHTCDRTDLRRCPCTKERTRQNGLRYRIRATAEERRAAHLRRAYGLTVEQFDAMRAAQDYRCAICSRHEDEIPEQRGGRTRSDGSPAVVVTKLKVDHCHRSNRVRKLLCHQCNCMLGMARDNPVNLRLAADYLEEGTVAE